MMANTPSSSASVMPQTVGAKTASSQSFKYPSIRTQAPSFDVMMAGTSAPSAHSSGFQHSGRGEKVKACQWVRRLAWWDLLRERHAPGAGVRTRAACRRGLKRSKGRSGPLWGLGRRATLSGGDPEPAVQPGCEARLGYRRAGSEGPGDEAWDRKRPVLRFDGAVPGAGSG